MKNGKRILSVTVKRMIDGSPDMSHLGEYGQRAKSKYAIDRRHSEDCQSIQPTNAEATGILERAAEYLDREYLDDAGHLGTAMREALGIDESIKTLDDACDSVTACDCNQRYDSREHPYFNPNHENYKGCPEDEIRKYCRQDYERAEALNRGEWCYIGIRADAEWSVTSAMTGDTFPMEAVKSVGCWNVESDAGEDHHKEIAADELAELKTQLRAIGFSARAISTAFKNATTKEEY